MTETQAQPNLEMQRKSAEQQARPELEKWRKDAEQHAEKKLDKAAIAAIEQTVQAIDSIGANKTAEALELIEKATGKVNTLLARNPELTLVPVSVEALIIDSAPRDIDEIRKLADAADAAVSRDDFPAARVLLGALRSEIRVRTYNLPLGIYPTALQEAARLLDQNSQAASRALLDALNTLVAVDQVTPIPILVAQEAINKVQTRTQEDKNAAREILEAAQLELDRAKALGYAGQDPEYAALKNDISNLKKQLKGNEDTSSGFSKLKARLDAFLKRHSDRSTSSKSEKSPTKAA
ncbi:MAG TPA: YfdX family protein [Acidobacteriaceae bacterium]